MGTILGTGIFNMDTIVRREYPEGPQHSRNFTETLVAEDVGGTCGNVMTILGWIGANSVPVACFDDSEEGLRMTEYLKRYGCDTRFVSNTPEGGTTLFRCTHKLTPEGEHVMSPRGTSPGSRFPKRHFLRLKDEAPALIEKLDFVPDLFFFDDPAAGHRAIARALREKGTIVYYEPEHLKGKTDLESVALSDIIKFSGEKIPDTSFTEQFPDKFFIQTLGGKGLRYRIPGKGWMTMDPACCSGVVDWEGAGDWTTSILLYLIMKDKAMSDGESEGLSLPEKKEKFLNGHLRKWFGADLEAAQTVAAQSVSFWGSKGLIYQAESEGPVTDRIHELFALKDIRSCYTDKPVIFVENLDTLEEYEGAYSDGNTLVDLDERVQTEHSRMYGILRSGEAVNMEGFDSWFWDEGYDRMVSLLFRQR